MPLKKVVEEIAEYELEKCRQVLEDLKNTKHEDKLNTQQFWKLKKKVCPRNQDPTTVMLDKKGNHLTSNKAISERAVEVYVDRLEGNKIKPHFKQEFGFSKDNCCLFLLPQPLVRIPNIF